MEGYCMINIVLWLVGQAVKTPPSHGGNRGSIPLRAVHYTRTFKKDLRIFILKSFFHKKL